MIFTNDTGLPASWTMGFQPDGRERLIVVVKATYPMPANGEEPSLAKEHVPLVEADRFTADPGASAPLFETDYAHAKPACDVLLVGSAWAPQDRTVTKLIAGLRVGSMVKQCAVVGNRRWRRRMGLVSASGPEPFQRMRLSYDVAFGGTDTTREADGATATFLPNPVGRGYWRYTDNIDGQPLPNTEQVDEPVRNHQHRYLPMAFTPLGRSWMPRRVWAGTFDDAWIKTTAPLWPADFDERYFQAAPVDQTIAYPQGGEEVVLRNLTPDGHRAFRLPQRRMPITFIPYQGRTVVREGKLDTIVFEPDDARFTLTWRVVLPLGRSIFDVKETLIGEQPRTTYEDRYRGKVHYHGLGEAVRARRKQS